MIDEVLRDLPAEMLLKKTYAIPRNETSFGNDRRI